MSRRPRHPSFELREPERFTAGTVGPPGQRVFYLQARQGELLVTLKAEKEQVGALGEYFASLLARLPGPAPPPPGEDVALQEPLVPAWTVGTLTVGYDPERDRVVVVAEEAVEEDEAEEAVQAVSPASARFELTRAQIAAFARRAQELMKAGRPRCLLCGRFKGPRRHVCARSNGHGRD